MTGRGLSWQPRAGFRCARCTRARRRGVRGGAVLAAVGAWIRPELLSGLALLVSLWVALPVQAASRVETIARVRPSIVAVGSISPLRSPRAVFFGTGFVVGDGTLVVTNAHVVDREAHFDENERLMVFVRRQGRDRGIPVQVLRRDERHDLAVLRLHGGRLPALALAGPGRRVREGDEVLFTGYPIGTVLGLYPVTHRGMVSAIVPIAIPAGRSRELTPERIHGLRHPFPVYQLDATAYPGNSGSPVYDPHSGRVLGIINMVFVKKRRENALREPSGISYAIPVAHLRRLLAGLAGAP